MLMWEPLFQGMLTLTPYWGKCEQCGPRALWQMLENAGRATGLKLVKLEVKTHDDLLSAIDAAAQAQAGALFVLPDDPMLFNLSPRIVELAAK